jgi:hypothetical protein
VPRRLNNGQSALRQKAPQLLKSASEKGVSVASRMNHPGFNSLDRSSSPIVRRALGRVKVKLQIT